MDHHKKIEVDCFCDICHRAQQLCHHAAITDQTANRSCPWPANCEMNSEYAVNQRPAACVMHRRKRVKWVAQPFCHGIIFDGRAQ